MSEESEAPKGMAERGWIAEPAGARFPAERHPPIGRCRSCRARSVHRPRLRGPGVAGAG